MIKIVKTVEEFNEEISSGKVVVDFFASWCGPCRMLGPILDSVSEEIDNVKFIKVDIDELESLPREFDVMSIPTIMVFENGELKKRNTGYMGKEELKSFILG